MSVSDQGLSNEEKGAFHFTFYCRLLFENYIFYILQNLARNKINYFLSNLKYVEKGWTNLNFERQKVITEAPKTPETQTEIGKVPTTIELWVSFNVQVEFKLNILKNPILIKEFPLYESNYKKL